MASALNTKINSYAIENGIEFDFAVAAPPTQTGTITDNTSAYWSLLGRSPVYEPTVGPFGGSGSWKFVSDSANFSRLRNNGGAILTLSSDGDYSTGFWAKANQLRAATGSNNAVVLFAFQPNTTQGFSINVTGGTAPFPYRISLTAANETFSTEVTMNTTDWYYFAVTKTGTNLNLYINNQLAQTRTNMQNATGTVFGWGDNFLSSDPCSVNISNWYFASTSVIGPTQIAEIWAAGSPPPAINKIINAAPATADGLSVVPTLSISVNNLEAPAIASALMVAPTIAVTTGDNVQITTSILVSAEFLPNIAVIADQNVNIVITDILIASTELINNVIITTGIDESFSAEEFVATAELVKPFLSEQPMIATATMPNATVVIPQNYYNLVNSLNPVFYYNFDGTTMQNYGSWAISSYNVGSTVTKNNASTGDMSLIGAGKSWKFTGNYNNAPNEVEVYPQTGQNYVPQNYNPFAPPLNGNPITDLIRSRSFALEYWGTTDSIYSGVGFRVGNVDIRFKDGKMGYEIEATLPGWTEPVSSGVTGTSYERYQYENQTSLILSDWNHVVINVEPAFDLDPDTQQLVLSATDQVVQFWINSNLKSTIRYKMDYNRMSVQNVGDQIDLFNTSDPDIVIPNPSYMTPSKPGSEQGNRGFWRTRENLTPANVLFDEVAIYDQPLTNSQIIDHYSFIANQNPNRSIFSVPLTASAISGSHVVLIESDSNFAAAPSLANAEIAVPSILAEQNINIAALPSTASALNTDATVYFGWTIDAVPATAYAERPPTYFLNDIYYEYVKTNINPYRYVTFDSADATLDYGTDNDYSVSPTTIGGTVVNPDLGINGKSVKTTGNSYITDGVILNESEWNDSWGTGQNSYHSAFWFQRALDDASTTGVRVLWNLNGYKDNQHVVLYQYQGKLHMQFNNGSGTWIQQDTGTLDLFDYDRHFIVIEFDHTNVNNNTVRLYVDTILKMTVSLGAYTGTTTNASSADSGPNNEINNRPRLSVGCLITPFGSTALPAIPANTKLIIDEIYWDKNAITQTQVSNVYNAMPGRTSTNFIASPLTSETTMVNPEISTSSIIFAQPLDSNALIVTPTLALQFSNIYYSGVANASADITEGIFGDSTTIVSDIFVATAILNSAGVIVGIRALPMTADVSINPPSQIMGLPLTDLSDYVRYLRIESYNNEILHYQEVK
jgi:hypothetical protein